MRMRKKKNGEKRLDACRELITERPDEPFSSPADVLGMAGAPVFLEIGAGKGGFACGMVEKYPEAAYFARERVTDCVVLAAEKAKARGINTCIDTAGQPFREAEPFFSKFQRLCELTDLFLADIKHIDPQEHLNLTGVKNDNILAMLRYLSKIGKPVWIRHVLVPGITDSDGYLRRTRAFIETLRNVQRIEVLPYHSMGAYKWDKLGLDYTLKDIQPPTAERIQNASEILNGLK